MKMRSIRLSEANKERMVVTVDEDSVIDYGGFGSIFAIENDQTHIVKRIEMVPPEPIGNANRYVAHIRTTRERLLMIRENELKSSTPRQSVIRSIDDIVDSTLSTHWSFDTTGSEITAVWYRQRVAPGEKLLNVFRDQTASQEKRLKIAAALIAAMITLCRAGLVHLDCVADNIFYDDTTDKLTLIDLDGCGIARQFNSAGGRSDVWDYRPKTLGHLNVVRIPPWYPQAHIQIGPMSGNFLLGERWVLLDTLIRILSWNRLSSLSWLDPALRSFLADSYLQTTKLLDSVKGMDQIEVAKIWKRCYSDKMNLVNGMMASRPSYKVPVGAPECLRKFTELAHRACVQPEELSTRANVFPYETFRQWLAL